VKADRGSERVVEKSCWWFDFSPKLGWGVCRGTSPKVIPFGKACMLKSLKIDADRAESVFTHTPSKLATIYLLQIIIIIIK
jgi:hypothetical protein